MNQNQLTLIEVSTSAFNEENFILLTSLDFNQIKTTLKPIKDNGQDYDNYDLCIALEKAYPNETIIMYPNLEQISI
jgi:hypothetical protein